MLNNISIIGYLTRDVEVRYTTNQKAVSEFTIACNRIPEGVDFIKCQCWNKLAENLGKYTKKGSMISITGKLRTDSYEDKDGNKKYKVYILANEIEYLTKKGNSDKTEDLRTTNEIAEDSKENNPFGDFAEEISISDDDLPF